MPEASIFSKTPLTGRFSWAGVMWLLGSLVFLVCWWVPNHYPPWASFHNEALAFLALILFAIVVLLSRREIRLDALPLIAVALVMLVWLQWAAGLIAYRGDAALSSLYLAGVGLAWWLGRSTGQSADGGLRLLDGFAVLMVLAAVLSVYIAVLQWLGLEAGHANLIVEKESGGRPGANLAQPNHLATMLLMASVMCMHLHKREWLKGWQLAALLLWMAAGLTMAESRASWISALALGGFFLWQGRNHWNPKWGTLALVWWLVLAGMWLSWKPLNASLFLTGTREVTTVAQDSGRLQMWRQMLAGIEQAPWSGYGWRQTVVGQKAGSNIVPGGLITDYAHSVVLDLMLWVGLPMALLILGVMAWWLLRAAIRVRDAQQWVMLATVVPVLVHSLVEFPFAYAYFLFTSAFLLGMLAALQRHGRVWLPHKRVAMPAGVVLLTIFSAVGGWVAHDYFIAEEDYRVMRFEMRKVGQRPQGHEPADLLLLDQLGEMLQLGRVLPYPGMPESEIERFRVASANTMWATAQLRYAVALGLNGSPDEATQQLQQLRNFYGEKSYAQARDFFIELQRDQYPQLGAVQLP